MKKKDKTDWVEDLWEIYKKFDKEMKKFVTVIKLKDLMKKKEEIKQSSNNNK